MSTRRRILIVDDETKVAFFLQESLEALGHDLEIVGVSSTAEALEQARQDRFDLLITDQRMPDMSGLELIRRVQELHPGIRSILITAYGSEETVARAQELGAFRYFIKPFHIEDFVQTVLDALRDDAAQGRHMRPTRPVDTLTWRLEELRREAGAQCILACNSRGELLTQTGQVGDLALDALLQTAADSIEASLHMAQFTGGSQTEHLIYHGGDHYDFYLAHVSEDLFLVLVFNQLVQSSRIGIVWLYTRRAIENLRRTRVTQPLQTWTG